jgi:hypothetical protein
MVPEGSSIWTQLRESVTAFVAQSLADMAIPILNNAAVPAENDDVDEARYAATWGQLHRMKKTLMNLFMFWAPFMQSNMEFCDMVLHFISNKFIVLLSSVKGQSEGALGATPADIFREVYRCLAKVGWLQYPEFVLQAVVIRGAASALISK